MTKNSTTITVNKTTKDNANYLKHHYRFKTLNDLLEQMIYYFERNNLNPKDVNVLVENLKKSKIETDKIEEFRDSLFRKIDTLERNILTPHYRDFNTVSDYIQQQFKTLNKDSKTIKTPQFLHEKELKKEVETTIIEPENSKQKMHLNFIFDNCKRQLINEDKVILTLDQFEQLRGQVLKIIPLKLTSKTP